MKIDLETIEIEGIDMKDYPDFVDAFISSCQFKDGTELTDQQLDDLTDKESELINEMIHNKQLY